MPIEMKQKRDSNLVSLLICLSPRMNNNLITLIQYLYFILFVVGNGTYHIMLKKKYSLQGETETHVLS